MIARWGWALAALVGLPAAAAAQPAGSVCDTCESCSAALARDHAFAELRGDLNAARATTCVRVAGRGATFDGHGHTVRGAAVAVEVTAEDVVVRNVHAQEGGVGFRVVGGRSVTLLGAAVRDARVGVRIEGSQNVRVVRATLSRNRVGVSMGADDAGRCAAPAALASTGVVIVRSRVEGGRVGVAACDAMPVLIGNMVVGNDEGVRLGEVRPSGSGARGGPWDECSCAPAPAGVTPGTLLLYSSGCGGCMVHESWLPQERARGAVIRARAGGADSGVEQARFDDYARHCGAEMVDALGVPGCVPNYQCPASGEVWKRRDGDRGLAVERAMSSPDDVVAFAEACRAAGRAGYGAGGRCVSAALRSNTLCGNQRSDLAVAGPLARWGSAGDRCGSVEAADGGAGRCDHTCDGVDLRADAVPTTAPPTPPTVPTVTRTMGVIEPPRPDAGVPAVVSPAQAPTAPGSGGGGVLWLVGGAVALIGAAAWWRGRRA